MSDMASRRARFLQGQQNRQVAEQERQNRFSGSFDDKVSYIATPVVKSVRNGANISLSAPPLQLRIVGGMIESTPRLPGDMRMLNVADVRYHERVTDLKSLRSAQELKQDRKYMQLIFPSEELKNSHPLWVLITSALAYDWDSVNNKRVYKHENDEYASIYQEILHHNNPGNNLDNGWQNSPTLMVNVISRRHTDWHRENKRTLVVSRGSWMTKPQDNTPPKERFNLGTKKSFYDLLFGATRQKQTIVGLVETYGHYEEFDVLHWREEASPWYRMVHARHGFEAPFWNRIGFVPDMDAIERPLTDEELSWQPWDFDTLFQPTNDWRIFSKLGYMMKAWDEASQGRSNLYEQMKHLAELDKQKQDEARAAGLVTGNTPQDEDDDGGTDAWTTNQTTVPTQLAPQAQPQATAPQWAPSVQAQPPAAPSQAPAQLQPAPVAAQAPVQQVQASPPQPVQAVAPVAQPAPAPAAPPPVQQVAPQVQAPVAAAAPIQQQPAQLSGAASPTITDPAQIPWDKLSDGTFNGRLYLGVIHMNDFERAMVIGINPDGSFVYARQYRNSKGQLRETKLGRSTDSNFYSPTCFHVDPLSGIVYDDVDDN